MALEADGRRGWIVGLGHRHPLNYPFELRYGREEGKRLGKPASINGTITTPWRVVMTGRRPEYSGQQHDPAQPLPVRPIRSSSPKGSQTAWVKPGRAVWRYVDGGPERL